MPRRLITRSMNDWARSRYWDVLKTLKMSETSNFNYFFRDAERGGSSKFGAVIFECGVPIAQAIYGRQYFSSSQINFQVYVRPEHRRRGIGRQLFEHVTKRFRRNEILIFPHDDGSDAFFKSFGADINNGIWQPKQSRT